MNIQGLLVLFIVALVFCSVGFYNFVYFMSVGYGLAVAAIGAALGIMFFKDFSTPGTVIAALLMIIYGLRLAGFLLYREFKNRVYKKVLKDASKNTTSLPFVVRCFMWLGMALLYVLQTSPLFFRLDNATYDNAYIYVGCIISAIGIIIETLADLQKSAQKKVRVDMVATKGLYNVVRCPNYLGEILFWTGVFIEGISAYANVWQFLFAFIGFALIVYVMIDSAKRLEIKQNNNYKDKEEYWTYANSTPILFPFIPLYHLSKWSR